ncbi:uracil-DNA glycosylase family protein [Albimonas pacifica]|uniref:Uracil-DNA glycosylase n=1 Tax=Albimonas pacifica TaxID=1114924 RepID=A0A1I3F5T1_9RHOB|nr:uracil-DNA glycosylase family protein [Albimonas pacifica]SFI06616.1 Uracil-DNA glycosylase [Albimonas pacifica]
MSARAPGRVAAPTPDPAAARIAALEAEIAACRACAGRFAATRTAHAPRPVTRISSTARLLIAGQAPGARVHASGLPFDDRSGDRLRDWLGVDRETFYDRSRVAILPMAFCFPGYDARGSDLPPPPLCAQLWRERALAAMPQVELTLLVGAHAQAWALGGKRNLTERVRDWRDHLPGPIPLPHPSWRNTAWLRRNPWFEEELVPWLRARVSDLL